MNKNIKITRPANDPKILRIFVDYCGMLPPYNVTTQLTTSSQMGVVKYVSEYNLLTKTIIPRTTVLKALKEDQIIV